MLWVIKGTERMLVNAGTLPYWLSLGWVEWEGPGSLSVVGVTQAAYDAIPVKDPNVLYVVS